MRRQKVVIQTLEEAPSLDNQSEFKKKKRKAKPVVIENLPLVSTESPYSEKIELLIKNLESLAAEEFPIPQMDIEIQQDFTLKPLLTAFKRQTALVHNLFMQARGEINRCIHETGYHEILVKHIEGLTAEIQYINEDLKNIQAAVHDRHAFLTLPTTHPEKCTEFFIDSQLKLQNTLEGFLNNFSALRIERRQDVVSQGIRANLVSFIGELPRDFNTIHSLVDSSVIEALRVKCLQHLGERTGFLNFRIVIKPLESYEIIYLVTNLFTKNSIQDLAILKRQFAAIHHMIAKVQAFPIQTINNYINLQDEIEKKNRQLHKEYHSIQDQITSGLLPELQEYLALFALLLPAPASVIKAKETIRGLQELSQELERFFIQVNNEELKQYEVTTSLKRKFTNAPKQGLPVWDNLEQMVIHLSKIQIRKQQDLDTLNDLQKRFEHLKKVTLESIHFLNIEYESQKTTIENELHEALIDTKAALNFQYQHDALSAEVIKSKIQEKLATTYDFLLTLPKSNTPLQSLLFRKETLLSKLRGYVTESKEALKIQLTPSLNQIHLGFSSYQSPLLTSFNPFNAELQQDENKASEALQTMNSIYHELDITSGRNLQNWFNRLENQGNIVHELVIKRNKTCTNALQIEHRLKTQAYRTSVVILKALQEEFWRIMRAYFPNAIALHPNDEKLQAIDDIIDATSDINLEWSKETLDKIDPRLFVLSSIYRDFHRINNRYINTNLFLHSDQTYLQELIDKVEVHLHNDHMEALSNAKRPLLVQWIRIYILRSLQAIGHQLLTYWKQDESLRYRFFVTLGACQTEHKLVETGNEVYHSLKALTAA
ncbi:hypothetical protein [Legionella clemsonensis]|uniref:Uncharacterized protein n=1 Tax=Legionella clemsonensis TaxID=1867846 RepID=A0A222P449_9GAMM|nr:hypothetical protein [Legionella clemsonensis]ASQ46626.1 hypothetical protein clem_10400 [Legionella clemsonensis]